MKIDLDKITKEQKFKIRQELVVYNFIMENKDEVDDFYKKIFSNFYFSAQPKMKRSENVNKYFEIMKECKGDENLPDLVIKLKHELSIDKYEFSFATKLLHTVNKNVPIYDSKVRNYLIENYHLNFKFYKNQSKNEEDIRKCIEDDWNLLVNWYEDFFKKETFKVWIDWFDKEFSCLGKNISNIKKIDFIIYVCGANKDQ